MNKLLYILTVVMVFAAVGTTQAGNPDRQGEAGGTQLLIHPYAKSAGLHLLTTSVVSGVEAMHINPAGIGRINKSEFNLSHTRYFEGTDISINAFGFAQKIGKNGAIGVSLMAFDLGDIMVTTEEQPEGTGATFSPSLFNLGVGYSHVFENKVSVGIVFRTIAESTAEVNAFGFSIDAGVQYVTGPQDNFRFGIALRNVGAPMVYTGQGLAESAPNPNNTSTPFDLTYFLRPQQYELPSLLNIGGSYDFILNKQNRLTFMTNFTANSFSQDQLGGGLEYAFDNRFMLRAGYKYEFGYFENDSNEAPVYTGLSAGFTIETPFKKGSSQKIGIDYAYRQTRIWDGTHNISVRIML